MPDGEGAGPSPVTQNEGPTQGAPGANENYQRITQQAQSRQQANIARREASQAAATITPEQPASHPGEGIDIAAASANTDRLIREAMEKRDGSSPRAIFESVAQRDEVKPVEVPVEVVAPTLEKLTNPVQEKIRTTLRTNLNLFVSPAKAGELVTKNDRGKIVLTEGGKTTGDNLRALIHRESGGHIDDVKAAVDGLKDGLKAEIKSSPKADAAPLRAKVKVLDEVLRAEKLEANREATKARNAEIATIRAGINENELAVFRKARTAEGRKDMPDSLLRNIMAQKLQAGVIDRPTHIEAQSAFIDQEMKKGVATQQAAEEARLAAIAANPQAPEVSKPSWRDRVRSGISSGINRIMPTTGDARNRDGFVPGLSDVDIASINRQAEMNPGDRAAFKADAVADAQERAFAESHPLAASEMLYDEYQEYLEEQAAEAAEATRLAQREEIRAAQPKPENLDVAAISANINQQMRDAGAVMEPRPLTIDEQAAAEIRRIDNGEAMSSGLSQEVRDRIYQVKLEGDSLRTPKANETHIGTAADPERQPTEVAQQYEASLNTAKMSWRERAKAAANKIKTLKPDFDLGKVDYRKRALQVAAGTAAGLAMVGILGSGSDTGGASYGQAEAVPANPYVQHVENPSNPYDGGSTSQAGPQQERSPLTGAAKIGIPATENPGETTTNTGVSGSTENPTTPAGPQQPFVGPVQPIEGPMQPSGEATTQTPSGEVTPTVEATAQSGEGLSQMIQRIDGSFDADNPSDWKKIEQMLDVNRAGLEGQNAELYRNLDAAREANPNLSGDEIKNLIRTVGGENYNVFVGQGQQLQTPR